MSMMGDRMLSRTRMIPDIWTYWLSVGSRIEARLDEETIMAQRPNVCWLKGATFLELRS